MIPKPSDTADLTRLLIPKADTDGVNELGTIVYMLSDSGLMAEQNVSSHIPKGSIVLAKYGDEKYHIKCNADLKVSGVIPSPLGGILAHFSNRAK